MSKGSPTPGRRWLAAVLTQAGDRAKRRGPDLPGVLEATLLLQMALRRTLGLPLAMVAFWARRLAVLVGLLLIVRGYFSANRTMPTRPRSLSGGDGWWGWYDQMKTLQAVLGFHQHSASVDNQWYQPLYPLLGAIGLHLAPAQPFLWSDLAGFAAAFLLFIPLAGLMGVSRITAVVVFLLINIGERTILENWVIPWNTTLTTPLILLGLLCCGKIAQAARFGAVAHTTVGRPQIVSSIWPFGVGFAVGLIPAFRPTDLLTIFPGLFVVLVVLLRSVRRPTLLVRPATAALVGFVLGAGIFLGSYLPVFGLHPSPYMVMSGKTGFEWRLLPQHWVTLVVGPRPLFPGQTGLVERFWWLAPGLAGAIAVSVAALLRTALPEGRRIHLIVLGAIIPYWCLYLCYRDLHPPGLWRYNNFHYFMWSFPLFGLFGIRLIRFAGEAVGVAWRLGISRAALSLLPVGVGLTVMVLAFCWRPQLGNSPVTASSPTLDVAHNAVRIPGGLSSIDDALLVASEDTGGRLNFGEHRLDEGGQTFATFQSFRAFPISGGAMVLPLRTLPHADGVLQFDDVALDPTVQPRLLRQEMVFGAPCWVPRIIRPKACLQISPLPGPLFPSGHQIDFNSKMETAYLIPGGWSDHADGRWTVGYSSSLQFRVANRTGLLGGVVVEVEGAGFIPRGSETLVLDVSANGHKLTRWQVSTTSEVALRVSIPASLIPADGEVLLTLAALNARRPEDALPNSTDRRLLGFRVRAVRMLPWSEHEDSPAAAP